MKVVFTSPQESITIYSDSRSALQALGIFNSFHSSVKTTRRGVGGREGKGNREERENKEERGRGRKRQVGHFFLRVCWCENIVGESGKEGREREDEERNERGTKCVLSKDVER